jgi:hypothetical protein
MMFDPPRIFFLEDVHLATGEEFFTEAGGLSGPVHVSNGSLLRLVNTVLNTSSLSIEFDIAAERTAVMCSGWDSAMVPNKVQVNVFLSKELPQNEIEHNALISFSDPTDSFLDAWLSRTQLNATRIDDGGKTWPLRLVKTQIRGLPAISVDVGVVTPATDGITPVALFGITCGIVAGLALIAAIALHIRKCRRRRGRGVEINRLDGDVLSDDI